MLGDQTSEEKRVSHNRLGSAPEQSGDIVYEHPLNERVRLFLRLEFLFEQHRHHRADRSSWGVRASLNTLLDILSIAGRSDLKTEIIKDLAEQHNALTRLRQRPGVDPARLDEVLSEINAALNAMQLLTTHATATALRDNEFLMTFANRNTVPGGTSGFDLPHFHAWLAFPAEHIRRDLDVWFADLAPLERAISLYLKLLRNSTEASAETAAGGIFVQMPQSQLMMLRITVASALGVYPEISGSGRHRYTIRFMTLRDINVRSTQATQNIPFQLQCCLF